MATKIQLRGDTSANWLENNPVLSDRELVVVDNLHTKIGDGVHTFSELPYSTGSELTVEKIDRPVRSNVNFIFEGNSRTSIDNRGTKVGIEDQFPSYPEHLMELPNFKNRGNYYNIAAWGASNTNLFTDERYNTLIKPHRPEANGGEVGIIEAFIFVMTGIFVIGAPSTVDAEFVLYKTFCDKAKADGFKVVVLGEFHGVSSAVYNNAGELARLKYNYEMMDYARTGGIYMYIDTDHLLGSNTADLFHADADPGAQFHLTTKGKKLIADYVNSRFNIGAYNATDAYIPYVGLPELFTKVDKTLFAYATNNYADNAAAKAAGLTAGMYYRTGDVSKVVW